MADYHRILSYLYRYDKNEKKECRGFVKAEQKQSGLKLTVQIEDDRLMEDMNLDLCFYRKKEDDWEMWRLDQLSSGNHQEEITIFYPAERLPKDFDIRQQYGILFLYQDSFFYGSVWIGDGIPITALMEKPKAKEQSIEKIQKIEESIETELIPEEKRERPAEEIIREDKKRRLEEKEERPEEEVSTNAEDLLTKMWIDTEKKAQPVDNIFNRAFRQGYQISIEQLEKLSPEAGKMVENPFLQKGYNRHQHLLVGKVMYAGRERYCIGVPGIYENREKYMAEIYQFPIFLSLTENRIKTGGFGYWLHLLQE